jgi:surface polysaccharide O-acyltransferase-like enzyme
MQKKTLTDEVSDKLKIISLLLMIMIVILHSYNLQISVNGLKYPGDTLNYFVQNLLSDGITRVAVPFFFLNSGFLFFLNISENQQKTFYISKLKSRMKTLFFPYIFWCLFGFLFFFSLQQIPFLSGYFNQKIQTDQPMTLFSEIFINPHFYQFWFIRDLILYVLISPLILWAIRNIPLIFIPFVSGIWLYPYSNFYYFGQGLCFFSLGAFISIHSHLITKKISSSILICLGVIWGGSCLMKLFAPHSMMIYTGLISKAGILAGIPFIWFAITDFVRSGTISLVKKYSPFSFLIFALHEPLITIVEKLYCNLFPVNPLSLLFLYFVNPLFVIILVITTGQLLKRYASGVFGFITGGR